jgi:hypothetical protein
MTLLFKLRQFITGLSADRRISNIIKSETELSKSEEKIFGEIDEFEHDEEYVKDLRYKNRNNILKLENALARVDFRNESKLKEEFVIEEKQTVKEFRVYENNLRRQVYDIKKVIELLKDIVEAEKKEVILDIEAPFDVVRNYFSGLRNVILGRGKFTREEYSKFQELIKDIGISYQNLVNITLKYVDNESKYFGQEISLSTYFKNRGKLKQQLNGKTQALIAQVERLEKILASYLELKQDKEFAEALLGNLAYFRKQFKELVQFCIDRVQISNMIMREAADLQKKKLNEMKSLKENLDGLYKQFLEQQEELMKKQSAYRKEQTSKRIAEFNDYRNSLNADTRKLDNLIISIEEEDVKELKDESDMVSVKKRIVNWNENYKRLAAAVAVLIGTSLTGPNQLTDNIEANISRKSSSSYNSTRTSTLSSPVQISSIVNLGGLKTFSKPMTRVNTSSDKSSKDNANNTAADEAIVKSSSDDSADYTIYANLKKKYPFLPEPLPDELLSLDKGAIEDMMNKAVVEGNKIDSCLNSMGVGKRDYLKNVFLEREFLSHEFLTSGKTGVSDSTRTKEYENKAWRAIASNNQHYDDMDYMDGLTEKHASRILPPSLDSAFVKADTLMKSILRVESYGNIFSIGGAGERGPNQILKDTWESFCDLDFYTFASDPEISLIVASRYIRYLYKFMSDNDPNWGTYDDETKLLLLAASYNCGQGSMQKAGFNLDKIPYRTKRYVKNIRIFMARLSGKNPSDSDV